MLRLVSKRILGAASREVPTPALKVLPRFYHEKVVDHCNNPRNVGFFNKTDPNVGSDIASSSESTEWVKREQMEERISIKDIETTKITGFNPFMPHSSTIIENAIKAAFKRDEAKRAFATATKATSAMPMKNTLRPISPHLSIYKPQSSSMSSIFNRISGATLTAMVLGFYLLGLKLPSICFTYAEFYQFFHFLANFSTICAEIAAVAMSYHLYEGIKRLLH